VEVRHKREEVEVGDERWTLCAIEVERGAVARVFWIIQKYKHLHVGLMISRAYKVAYLRGI
jgi:hypothetical protein